MGVPMNYGLCHGGPWNKKHLAHPASEPVFRVAIDTHTKKAIPAMVASPSTDPHIKFGEYRWDIDEWLWEPD